MVVFVSGALPGERATIAIDAVKPTYASAHAVKIEAPSAERADPACDVFPACGGCQVRHFSLVAQRRWKRKMVADALARLGGFEDVDVAEVRGDDVADGYRNKAALAVTRFGAPRVGFYAARSHRIVPLERCPVLLPRIDAAVSALLRAARDEPRVLENVVHIVLRASATRDELVAAFTTERPHRELARHAGMLRERVPALTGLLSSWDLATDNAVLGRRVAALYGSPVVREHIAGVELSFGISSFFQTNTGVLEAIAQRVLAACADMRRVVDLYCGVGTFAIALAKRGVAASGVESFQPAVDDAVANAAANGVVNASFECAAAETATAGARGASLLKGADAAIVDPPRKGCEREVLDALAQARVPKVLYLSCNPATLARDARVLADGGYALTSVEPYDMFPQTGHVEVLATFGR